jgi:hypothetical protein
MMNYLLSCAILGFSLLGFVGCSGTKSVQGDEALRQALQDFAQFLEALPSDGVKPPKKMAEFLPREPMAPIAAEYLQNGKLVYFWGAGLSPDGQKIIAYEKAAETSGGWVLLENGTVQQMTSEAFSAAPKASK